MKPLRPGARIAVVSPSGAFDPARLEKGLEVVRSWGYQPELLPGIGARHRYLAGDDATRARDLVLALTSPRFDAVWMVRGGYGLARIVPRVPWDDVRPVPFLGFSDGTALLNPLVARGGVGVHAPVITSLGDVVDDVSREHLRRLLAGEEVAPMVGEARIPGRAEGRLVGGNLCVLASMCGTPWQLRSHGCIVVLEEVGESPYKVDRLLHQVISAGCLDGAVGFALGTFTGAEAPAGAGWDIYDVLLDALAPFGVPVVANLPIGHGAANLAFPMERSRIQNDTLVLGDTIVPGRDFPEVELA